MAGSDPKTAFAFDFASDPIAATDSITLALQPKTFPFDAVAQWLRIRFADDLVYENAPGPAGDKHWRIVLTPLVSSAKDGEAEMRIEVHRDRWGVAVSARDWPSG